MAARVVLVLLVFFVALNGFSWLMISTGTADFYGINAETGDVGCEGEICIEDPEDPSETEVGTSASSGDTLFGQITRAARQVGNMFSSAIPALAMLERLGVPWEITAFLGSIISMSGVIGLVMFIRGFSP